MTTFAEKRHLVERILTVEPPHERLRGGPYLSEGEESFALDLAHAGLLSNSGRDWNVEPTTATLFRALTTGVLRRLATSAWLDVLQDHDLIRKKGAEWRWVWIE